HPFGIIVSLADENDSEALFLILIYDRALAQDLGQLDQPVVFENSAGALVAAADTIRQSLYPVLQIPSCYDAVFGVGSNEPDDIFEQFDGVEQCCNLVGRAFTENVRPPNEALDEWDVALNRLVGEMQNLLFDPEVLCDQGQSFALGKS